MKRGMSVRTVDAPTGEWRDLYNAYLRTPAWREKREQAFARWGRLCPCGEPATDVDHLTYRRLGNELPRDLLPLCRPCHAKVTKARSAAAAKPGEGFVKVTERTLGIDLSAHLPLEAGFRSRLERRSAKPRTTPPLPRVTALERIRVIAEANKDGSGPWEEVIALVVEANR